MVREWTLKPASVTLSAPFAEQDTTGQKLATPLSVLQFPFESQKPAPPWHIVLILGEQMPVAVSQLRHSPAQSEQPANQEGQTAARQGDRHPTSA